MIWSGALGHLHLAVLRAGHMGIRRCLHNGFLEGIMKVARCQVRDRLAVSFVLVSGIVLAWHKSSFTGIEGHLAVGGRQ
jgi:hypothetical protein